MAILTSRTLLRTLALFHITLAFYLLTSPALVASHNIILIMSQAMDLPDASTSSASFGAPNQPIALAALFLTYLSIADLAATGLEDLAYHEHWGLQAPLRLLGLFVLEGWVYLTKPADRWGMGGLKGEKNGWDELRNGLVFTWGFVELFVMFWSFLKLREERIEVRNAEIEKRAMEQEAKFR